MGFTPIDPMKESYYFLCFMSNYFYYSIFWKVDDTLHWNILFQNFDLSILKLFIIIDWAVLIYGDRSIPSHRNVCGYWHFVLLKLILIYIGMILRINGFMHRYSMFMKKCVRIYSTCRQYSLIYQLLAVISDSFSWFWNKILVWGVCWIADGKGGMSVYQQYCCEIICLSLITKNICSMIC